MKNYEKIEIRRYLNKIIHNLDDILEYSENTENFTDIDKSVGRIVHNINDIMDYMTENIEKE